MNSIVILNFSGRKHGNCSRITEEIELFYNKASVCSVRIADHFTPCGQCDCECLKTNAECPVNNSGNRRIMEDICASEVTYFIIPNYCGAPCANYYAFNERSVGWFNGDEKAMTRYMSVRKRFIIVSNSKNEVFEEAMRQQTLSEPDVLYLASKSFGKRSVDGDLMDSTEARLDLIAFLRGHTI